MQTIKISATKARNEFFNLLNQVASGKQFVIKRDNEEVAMLSPKKKQIDWKDFRKASEAARGILKDYNPEDNPLRKKGSTDFLGKWDKGLTKKKSK